MSFRWSCRPLLVTALLIASAAIVAGCDRAREAGPPAPTPSAVEPTPQFIEQWTANAVEVDVKGSWAAHATAGLGYCQLPDSRDKGYAVGFAFTAHHQWNTVWVATNTFDGPRAYHSSAAADHLLFLLMPPYQHIPPQSADATLSVDPGLRTGTFRVSGAATSRGPVDISAKWSCPLAVSPPAVSASSPRTD